MNDGQPTLHDVLEAVSELSTAVDLRFDRLEKDMTTVKGDITTIKSTMVTKDYLDIKLADMKGDMVLLMRKEDNKVVALVELLQKKSIISQSDAQKILGMDPFPQGAL